MSVNSLRIGILVVAYNAETTLRSVLQRIPSHIMASDVVATEEVTGGRADNGEQQTKSQTGGVDNHKASLSSSFAFKADVPAYASSKLAFDALFPPGSDRPANRCQPEIEL